MVGPRPLVAGGQVLGDADDDPADDGAAGGVQAAQDDGGEGEQGDDVEVAVQASAARGQHHPGDGGDGRGDGPGQGEHPPGADALGHGRLLVEGGGPHGHAHARVAEEDEEGGQGGRGQQDGPQVLLGQVQPAHGDLLDAPRIAQVELVEAPDGRDRLLEDEQQADRHHDHREGRLTDHAAQDDPLGGRADQAADGHGHGDSQIEGHVPRVVGVVGQVGAQDDEAALGEVDHPRRLVDDDEAQGHQGVEGPEGEAGEAELQEVGHPYIASMRSENSRAMAARLTFWVAVS